MMAHLRTRWIVASAFLVLLANQTSHAQSSSSVNPSTATVGPAFGYTAQGSNAPFSTIAGQPSTLYLPFGGIANPIDDGFATYNLPFNFTFFGRNYEAGSPLFLNANGYMSFGTLSISPLPTNLLADGASFGNQPAIAPMFMDLAARGMQEGGPGLYAQLTGRDGARKLIFEWSAMQDYNGGNESGVVSFQATLFEGTNGIRFNYGSTIFGTDSDNGRNATIGIRDTTFANPPDNVLQWGYKANTEGGIGVGLPDGDFQIEFGFSAVPEPTSIALCAVAGATMAGALWRRSRNRKRAVQAAE